MFSVVLYMLLFCKDAGGTRLCQELGAQMHMKGCHRLVCPPHFDQLGLN